MSAERVLQAAVYAALTGSAPYMALVTGGVFDSMAPQDTATPYTVIGEITEVLDPTQELDGYAYTLTIHDFTGGAGSGDWGKRKGQLIKEARNAVLHNAQLDVAGWGLTRMTYDFGEPLVEGDDPDSPVFHQVTRYSVEALST